MTLCNQGPCARAVADLMMRMRREMGGEEPAVESEIDSVILVDRCVDLVTPLLTELTYEGLIDECFKIQNSERVLGTIAPELM